MLFEAIEIVPFVKPVPSSELDEAVTPVIDDNFLCYSRFTIEDNEIVVNNHDDLHRFYSSIREKLVDIVDGKYDYNQFNRISYGDIPNINIKYTQ